MKPEKNRIVALVRRVLPMTPDFHGQRLFVRIERKLLATPMVAVLAAVATTDVAFAADSIPAIYAVTDDPFLVFAANAFSVLGLLAMYFLLAEIMVRFRYLRPALALILVFVGAKMALADVYHLPISLSLAVIVAVISTAVAASLLRPEPIPHVVRGVAQRHRGGRVGMNVVNGPAAVSSDVERTLLTRLILLSTRRGGGHDCVEDGRLASDRLRRAAPRTQSSLWSTSSPPQRRWL